MDLSDVVKKAFQKLENKGLIDMSKNLEHLSGDMETSMTRRLLAPGLEATSPLFSAGVADVGLTNHIIMYNNPSLPGDRSSLNRVSAALDEVAQEVRSELQGPAPVVSSGAKRAPGKSGFSP